MSENNKPLGSKDCERQECLKCAAANVCNTLEKAMAEAVIRSAMKAAFKEINDSTMWWELKPEVLLISFKRKE